MGVVDGVAVRFCSSLVFHCYFCVIFSSRETHGSGATYHRELAKQLAVFLEGQLKVSVCVWVGACIKVVWVRLA